MITISKHMPMGLMRVTVWPTTWFTGDPTFLIDRLKDRETQRITMFDRKPLSSPLRGPRHERDCQHLKVEGNLHSLPAEVTSENFWQSSFGDAKVWSITDSSGYTWSRVYPCSQELGYLSTSQGGSGTFQHTGKGDYSVTVTINGWPKGVGDVVYLKCDFKFGNDYTGKFRSNSYEGTGTAYQTSFQQAYKNGFTVDFVCRVKDPDPPVFGEYYRTTIVFPWFETDGGRTRIPDWTKMSFPVAINVLVASIRSMLDVALLYKLFYRKQNEMFARVLEGALANVRGATFNGIAYVRDLYALLTELKPVVSSIALLARGKPKKAVKRLSKALSKVLLGTDSIGVPHKDLASLYVYNRYGLRLTVRDTSDLIDLLRTRAIGYNRFNSGLHETWSTPLGPVSCRANIAVYTKDADNSTVALMEKLRKQLQVGSWDVKTMYRAARRADMIPTGVNIWDFIPYSFVVDWIVPVSDILESLDVENDLQYFDIENATWSLKLTKTYEIKHLIGIHGNVRHVLYDRRYLDMAGIRRNLQSTSYAFGGGLTLRNLFTGLALVVQRGRI